MVFSKEKRNKKVFIKNFKKKWSKINAPFFMRNTISSTNALVEAYGQLIYNNGINVSKTYFIYKY